MTDAAWLSSARVVRCWVKSRNERNPCYQLPSSKVGHSGGTAGDKPEEGGDDVKSSWLLRVGLHTCYNGNYREELSREAAPILKSCLSSDCSLQLENMKLESLVIADQHAAVNTFPGLYTPPVTPWEFVLPDGVELTCLQEAGDHGRVSDWGEVVTR